MHSILDGFVIHNEDLNILFNILLGLISGAIISAGYTIAHKNKKYSKNFARTPTNLTFRVCN